MPLGECSIVHRLGHLDLGEASIAIAVSSAHRADAFAAGQWLIDTIKEVVPIWKRENWADGTTEWVHPGLNEKRQTTNDQWQIVADLSIPSAACIRICA